jgi:hypothetical protein
MTSDLAAFNKLIHDSNAPAIQAPAKIARNGTSGACGPILR